MLGQRRFSKGFSPIWTRGPGAAGIIALGALTSCATPLTRQPSTRASQTHTLGARGPLLQPVTPASQAALSRVTFVSFNVPNLHYIEDDWRFTSTIRYRLPNEYEIYDGLQTVRLLGGTVIRIYALSVRKPTDTPELVRHVTGPGQFDESSFQVLDRVLADAGKLGIQLIIPFVNNWAYWGGVAEYAGFRGKSRDAFFNDPEVIGDFEKTVEHVILRTNSVNGRLYRDDPAIYAWETGNELSSQDRWVTQIARFIKQLDPTHALIDGCYGPRIRERALDDPNIDIVSSHHYGPAERTLHFIDENVRSIGGKKRYLIGEFGLLSAADTERVLHHALSKNVEGVLLWSLRFHNRDGGFYCHMEKPPFQAYHFPGFASGHDYEEQPVMQLMRRFAYKTRGLEVPALPNPAPPALLPVTSAADIRWRGSVGARYYVVERETIGMGHWQIVGHRVERDANAVPRRVRRRFSTCWFQGALSRGCWQRKRIVAAFAAERGIDGIRARVGRRNGRRQGNGYPQWSAAIHNRPR